MNEIAKLIKAYNHLRKNIDTMRQDLVNIMETDFGMQKYQSGNHDDENNMYDTFFKEKMLVYINIDVSVEIPFLLIYKLDMLISEGPITADILNEHKYKGYSPRWEDLEEDEIKKVDVFTTFKHEQYKATVSPKIDILSIDSADTVNTEIKKLISCMINKKTENFKAVKLRIVE